MYHPLQDPRLTVAWAKKHNVPLEKLFSKVSSVWDAVLSQCVDICVIVQTLLTKFPWAVAEIESDPDWRF